MEKIIVQWHKFVCGEMVLGVLGNEVCLCDWDEEKRRKKIDSRICQGLKTEYKQGPSTTMEKLIGELEEYFAGVRKTFDISLRLVGTDFQQTVWTQLMRIPYGETISYGQLATLVGKPSAVRAVASACSNNAVSILVPCHRVIGSNGSLTGYAGGINVKCHLLNMEKKR